MSGTWLSGWLTNDVVTATELSKAVGSIYTTTLGGSAATIDTGAVIPAGYAHLRVIVYARGDTAAAQTGLRLQFNGDTAANYDFQNLTGVAATAAASETFATTSILVGAIPAATAGANLFGSAELVIPAYSLAVNNKTVNSRSSAKTGTTTGLMQSRVDDGFWRSNAAITRIVLFPTAGNFVTGTVATLYVMGS